MNGIDRALLEHRFELGKPRYISERLEKSPNITEHCCSLSGYHHVSYAVQDFPVLPLVQGVFLGAYMYVKDWFGYENDMMFDLWMAPEVIDLQYMAGLPCEESSFFAPGRRNGMHVILFVSPLSCRINADKDRLLGIFAHEITHYVVQEISYATVCSMKRKQELDVPMWLEEGICQLIDSELYPSLQQRRAEKIAGVTKWYDWGDLWNDLSSCDDPVTAYLQAYRETKALVETRGKAEIIRLLYLNRTHSVDWNDLP
jgi:hypothetical protein